MVRLVVRLSRQPVMIVVLWLDATLGASPDSFASNLVRTVRVVLHGQVVIEVRVRPTVV